MRSEVKCILNGPNSTFDYYYYKHCQLCASDQSAIARLFQKDLKLLVIIILFISPLFILFNSNQLAS